MKKVFRRLTGLCLTACMLASVPVSADYGVSTQRVITNLEFDSMTTNSVPFGVTFSKANGFVRQYDDNVKNKVLEITEPSAKSAVEISLRESSDSMVFSFDYMQHDTVIARSVSIVDSASVTSELFSVATDGMITLADGRNVMTLISGKWYNISIVCRMSEKRYDFYADGKCIASKVLMQNHSSFGVAKSLKFSAGTGGVGSKYCIDNIRCLKGTELAKESELTHETFSEKWTEPVVIEEKADESSVYINQNFNSGTVGSKPSGISLNLKNDTNSIVVSDELSKEDLCMKIVKGTSDAVDPFGDITVNDFAALSAVLDFKFRSDDTDSIKVITFRDNNAKFNEVFRAVNGGELRVFGKNVGTYEAGKTYHIAVIIDYENQCADAYIDGELKGEMLKFSNTSADVPATVRVQMPSASAAGSAYYDDLRFYAGSKIKTAEELSAADGASASADVLITPEEDVKATLENACAVQLYGNKAYSGGAKADIAKGGEVIGNIAYAPIRFVAESFGAKVEWSDAGQSITVSKDGNTFICKVNSSDAVLNADTVSLEAPVVLSDYTAMLPANEFKKVIPKLQISTNEQYGLAVFDANQKNLTASQLKDIYNYITYTRPSAEQILKDYEAMKNVHPRLMVTPGTFERIKTDMQTDGNLKKWYDSLVSSADITLEEKHTYYYIPDGLRLLDMSRQLLSRARTLSLIYNLTGEQKYLDYLWGEMEAVCNFNDWNSENHFLDTAEMTAGVAIAYDWCYEFWTPEQRKVMEDALLNLGVSEGKRCLDFNMPSGTQWIRIENNWNQVCAGGISVGALALMDLYPEYCADILERCLLSLESSLAEYAPDGAWYEGPDYWSYAIRYLVYHMASLQSALGTDYGYLDGSYMKTTADYITYTQSSQGSFNIGDAGNATVGESAVFYLARKFDMPELTIKRLQDMEMYSKGPSATDMIFYQPSHTGDPVELNLDAKFREIEMATFRNSWDDPNAMFAGIHGGYNNAIHGNLDAGTFILDASGERWAVELGSGDYNQGGYFTLTDGYRYKLYRCSAQGQNVLAMNPASELGQEQFGTAKITEYVSKPQGGYSVLDMASVYGNKVETAKRGLKFDTNRTQVVVQDEIKLTYITDLMWFMHTKADIEISENGKYAILTQNGKKLFVGLDCTIKNAKFEVSSATPLENSLIKPSVYSNASFKRLQINMPGATGEVTLAVRFIPISGDMMLSELIESGTGKTIPIDRWSIPDGEISAPRLNDIKVNGEALEGFEPTKTSYSIEFEFGNDATPVVEASADSGYATDILSPESANGLGEIKVYDKDNPYDATYYSLSFRVLPLMGRPEGYTKHNITNIEVSSEPQAANPKSHAIDGNLESRWSAEGNKEWMIVDLGEVKDVNVVTLAFYSGSARVTYFNIQVSEDGKNWTTVHSGESSGVTDDYESVFVGDRKARYVKINSFGNSVNAWNSYSEIEVYGNVNG